MRAVSSLSLRFNLSENFGDTPLARGLKVPATTLNGFM